MDQPLELLPHLFLPVGRNEQEHESASAGAEQFAADRAGRQSVGIDRVDPVVGHFSAQVAFDQPGFVEQLAEVPQVAAGRQHGEAFLDQVLQDPHRTAAVLDVLDVGAGHAGGRALDARVEEHEPGVEFAHAVGRHDDRPDRNLAAGQEADVVQSAVGRGHLVLRADGLVEQFLLDVDALGGQLVLADHPPFQGVQGVQQPDGKGRTGPHAAAGGQVAVVVDFHAAGNLQVFQCLADGGVRDLVDRMAVLDLRVDHADAVFEEGRQVAAGQVAVLVDRRGDHRAAVVPIPPRIIGSPAQK